ncbi:hypothetical protein IMCC1933_31210 [Rhodobacteraceae bacterium IMCC1933]|nr:hypothetical protein [Rhodobacteraceae bacterium IMCC1933]
MCRQVRRQMKLATVPNCKLKDHRVIRNVCRRKRSVVYHCIRRPRLQLQRWITSHVHRLTEHNVDWNNVPDRLSSRGIKRSQNSRCMNLKHRRRRNIIHNSYLTRIRNRRHVIAISILNGIGRIERVGNRQTRRILDRIRHSESDRSPTNRNRCDDVL